MSLFCHTRYCIIKVMFSNLGDYCGRWFLPAIFSIALMFSFFFTRTSPAMAESLVSASDFSAKWVNTNRIQLTLKPGDYSLLEGGVSPESLTSIYYDYYDGCVDPRGPQGRTCLSAYYSGRYFINGRIESSCPSHGTVRESGTPAHAELDDQTNRIEVPEIGASIANFKIRIWSQSTGQCAKYDLAIKIEGGATGGATYGEWVASNAIKVYEDGKTYMQASDNNSVFLAEIDGTCSDGLLITGTNSNGDTLADYYDHGGAGESDSPIRPQCKVDRVFKGVIITKAENKDKPPISGDPDETGGDSQGRNANCMTNANGFGLAWIMCPVYNVAESAMNRILNYMRDIMYTNLGEDNQDIKAAWSGLKDVANGVLIVALLMILIGQALRGSW